MCTFMDGENEAREMYCCFVWIVDLVHIQKFGNGGGGSNTSGVAVVEKHLFETENRVADDGR